MTDGWIGLDGIDGWMIRMDGKDRWRIWIVWMDG